MNKKHVISKIREYMAEQFGITPAFVADDANFDNLGLDSLDRCEICMELEDTYDVIIENEECFESATVSELADAVLKKIELYRGNPA